MAFDTEVISVKSWIPSAKAHEVKKLIKLAEECGIKKSPDLFNSLVNIVYLGAEMDYSKNEKEEAII